MASEPGNTRRDRQEKVVSLGRHELVAEIDRKLSEARRMFSLRHYEPCEQLVREILESDPQNSRAKALLDLTTIKLSKKRLYRKIASTTPPQSQEAARPKQRERETSAVRPTGNQGEFYSVTPDLQKVTEAERITRTRADQETGPPAATLESSVEIAAEKNNLRERTVSALVELFQRKDLSLSDWRDPRRIEKNLETANHVPPATSPVSSSAKSTAVPSPPVVPSPPEIQMQKPEAKSVDVKLEIARNPEVRSKTIPHPANYQEMVEKKLEERSEDLRKSEIKTISIAQIKKYLYQEEYEHCSQELSKIRKLFPNNTEIQAFVENTSKRLAELQHIKTMEIQARDLMLTATMLYQEGKLPEALIASNEVMRLLPNHQQAREFVDFVNKRLEKGIKKASAGDRGRHCWSCGVAVDRVSRYCFRCGRQLF
jgi:hypothetical protein